MNPLRVLLVDDEPDQILLARAYLSTADPAVSVESSASAPEALKQLENQSFDRIVSDYLMTDMNGLELCVTLRERGVQTPFTLFTGRGSEEVAEKAFQVGVDDYLRKEKSPSVYTVLVRNIRSILGTHRADRTLRENEKLSFALSNSSVSITYLDRDLHDVLDTGASADWEAEAATKAGNYSHAEPRRGPGGEIIGLAIISIDVTDQKSVEERLKKVYKELQRGNDGPPASEE